MTYDLYIGDRLFSSWSLRGWLMLKKFGLPYRLHVVGLYAGTFENDMKPLHPARLVPALRTPEGDIIGESLAIAETLAERHPGAGLWPQDPSLRARARWLCAEMAAGFANLRNACPMQLAHINAGFGCPDDVRADLARIEDIWRGARDMSGTSDGWLFGEYCLADVFYTPVAARIVGYNLPVSEGGRAYALRLLSDPSVQSWRREALKTTYDPFPYQTFEPLDPWPVATNVD